MCITVATIFLSGLEQLQRLGVDGDNGGDATVGEGGGGRGRFSILSYPPYSPSRSAPMALFDIDVSISLASPLPPTCPSPLVLMESSKRRSFKNDYT